MVYPLAAEAPVVLMLACEHAYCVTEVEGCCGRGGACLLRVCGCGDWGTGQYVRAPLTARVLKERICAYCVLLRTFTSGTQYAAAKSTY